MIKILHLIDNLGAGGRERQLIELVKKLDSNSNIHCSILTFSKTVHYQKIAYYNTPVFTIERRYKKDISLFFQLWRYISSNRPAILHTWSSMTAVYAAPLSRVLRIPLINGMVRSAHFKMSYSDERWIRARLTFPFSNVIISNCRAGLRAYGVPSRKAICIPNGFDFNRLKGLEDPSLIRAKYGIHTSKIVGMVASFSKNKDYRKYIRVAINVLRRRQDVTFLAIGDGNHLPLIKALVPSKLRKRIKFLGRLDNVESIINTFSIGVLITDISKHGEGLSNSIMEYMASGKPVIATDYGGNCELIKHGFSGYLVSRNDPSLFEAYIHRLLDDVELASILGKNGRNTITDEFSINKMVNRYKNLYNRIALGNSY